MMEILTSTFIGIGLAMDAFAVSLGVGTTSYAKSPRPVFRLAFHFGFFQGMMTFLGWLAGSTIAHLIGAVDHWIAFCLLAIVGIRMIREGLQKGSEECHSSDPSRGGTLMILCIATSLDAMAVGLGLAMIQVNIYLSSGMIALVTFALSMFGLLAGNGLGNRFGKKMEVLGGLILNLIGIRILLSHLLAF